MPENFRKWFRLALRKPPVERDVADEVEFHLTMRANELIARGMHPDEARAEATRRFGDPTHWSKAMSETDHARLSTQHRAELLEDVRQDLQFAWRSFGRSPLFTSLAVLTLALGIGANAAVFGVVKSVLLDALPYREPDRLVRVFGETRDGSMLRAPLSAGSIVDIREQAKSFSSVGAMLSIPQEAVYATDNEPILVKVIRAEPDVFATLGSIPALGRNLVDVDAAGDTAFNVMLTHAAWMRFKGGDSSAVGSKLVVNGIPRTIVGVLSADFVGPIGDADVYMPMSLAPYLTTQINARMRHNHALVARLAPGATLENASAEIKRIANQLSEAYPREAGSNTMAVASMRDSLLGDTRTPLLVLMASAALVLIITCANLAGALLSRTLTRRKEFAIRAALGAGRGRLVRQLLTESTLLALMGGALGVALAWGGLRVLSGVAAHALPSYASLTLDTGALAITATIAILTGLAFGIAPAVSVAKSDPQDSLREETRGGGESVRSRQLRGMLVAAQIALCVSLLSGAGLLARSLWHMATTPLGYESGGVLTASVHLTNQRYRNGAARAEFYANFEERVRALPGVVSVATASAAPTKVNSRNGFYVVGAPPLPPDVRPLALYMDVSDDYFRTLGIPLVAGRSFSTEERMGGPLSIIITESLAKQYWPNGNVVGSRVTLSPEPNAEQFTVVGVAGEVRNDPAVAGDQPVLYLSNRQAPWNGPVFLIRTSGNPTALVDPVRRALKEFDPNVPIHSISTMEQLVSERFAGKRLPVILMTSFGALALILASVGVYAMFAAMAVAREREFAVRMALGSQPSQIAMLVLRQGATWMGIGVAAGIGGVVLVSRAVQSLLYGVPRFDIFTLAGAAVLLVLCATIALLVPVRRATRVDPNSILR